MHPRSRANERHGVRVTNADKRARVENAIREFEGKSARLIADICGVSPTTICSIRGIELSNLDNPTVTGKDGKQYKARKPKPAPEPIEPSPEIAFDPEPFDEPDDEPEAFDPAPIDDPRPTEPPPHRPLPGQRELPIVGPEPNPEPGVPDLANAGAAVILPGGRGEAIAPNLHQRMTTVSDRNWVPFGPFTLKAGEEDLGKVSGKVTKRADHVKDGWEGWFVFEDGAAERPTLDPGDELALVSSDGAPVWRINIVAGNSHLANTGYPPRLDGDGVLFHTVDGPANPPT